MRSYTEEEINYLIENKFNQKIYEIDKIIDEKITKMTKDSELKNKKILTCEETAKLYPIGIHKLRELCKNRKKHKFPCFYIGNKAMINREKLDSWLDEEAIGQKF